MAQYCRIARNPHELLVCRSFSWLQCLYRPEAMDAPTILSLSAAIGHDVPEALLQEMQRAETERMGRNELESYIAQKHFLANLQTHPNAGSRTWESAYRMLLNVLTDLRHGIAQAVAHLRWNRIGEAEVLLTRLEVEVDADSEDSPMSDEDDDMV